jgi:dTDP-4-dehydrorhamnose reductase
MSRILLTGADGQVGWELRRTLAPLGDVVACTRRELDISDLPYLRARLAGSRMDAIVKAAAYTAVDDAESNEALAARINGEAPRVLAQEAGRMGAWLVHYSTDYVFDGAKAAAYTEDDETNPLNAYGRTKLAGEQAIAAAGACHMIFRTSWVYAARGRNFLRTMLRLASKSESLRIVDDQRGAPTWARMVAEATALVLAQALSNPGQSDALRGVYHLTCGGDASWREFAEAIIQGASIENKPRIVPISTAEYPTPARRPRNSLLANDRVTATCGIRLPDWRSALSMCLADMDSMRS